MYKKSWFKKKHYPHFTQRIASKEAIKKLHNLVKNPSYIASHSFFPLIHKSIVDRKYKKIKDSNGLIVGRFHKYMDNGTLIDNKKPRQIYFANHLDSHIYAFYAKEIVGDTYDKLLYSIGKDFSDCICAYRRIEVESSHRGKNNTHFAKEVFEFISQQDDCVALAFDIKSFFDTLCHRLLKKSWKDLLQVDELPKDHYNIYKSITKFKYVNLDDIFRTLNIKSERESRRKKIETYFEDIKDFRELIIYKKLFKENPSIDRRIGIPQGTAISAVLANLYLLDFDKFIYQTLQSIPHSLYRRYSDDIIIVCPPEYEQAISDIVYKKITDYKLVIQKEKTEVFHFKRNSSDNLVCTYHDRIHNISSNKVGLKYLGFEYDGMSIKLKDASVSKYYREMKASVRSKYKWAKKGVLNERLNGKQPNFIHRNKLYRRFSHLRNSSKKRNYYQYAKQAAIVFGEDLPNNLIKKQLKNHFKILTSTIDRYDKKLNLHADKLFKRKLSGKK